MLSKYSFGIGDRFAHQGQYQLQAFVEAANQGIRVTPVWNKSYREHITVGSEPSSVYKVAKEATRKLHWNKAFAVDADHITLETVDAFIPNSSFFTIDIANQIDKKASKADIQEFVKTIRSKFLDELKIDGLSTPLKLQVPAIRSVAEKFLFAIQRAAEIYKRIKNKKGEEPFVVEISMDEVDAPQNPTELFLILHMIVSQKLPIDTLAPKFTGRFNKGIDYEGDIQSFEKEFEDLIILMKYFSNHFGLKESLKISVHTGSDKFSLYPIINKLIKKHKTGLHLKTAGTTWLEEMIGLAEAGGEALELAKSIYKESLQRFEELTAPYSTVLNINKNELPSLEEMKDWTGEHFANALRHNPSHDAYNPSFRQLIHTAYKVAANKGEVFTNMLLEHERVIGKNVYENIYHRHLKPLFLD